MIDNNVSVFEWGKEVAQHEINNSKNSNCNFRRFDRCTDPTFEFFSISTGFIVTSVGPYHSLIQSGLDENRIFSPSTRNLTPSLPSSSLSWGVVMALALVNLLSPPAQVLHDSRTLQQAHSCRCHDLLSHGGDFL